MPEGATGQSPAHSGGSPEAEETRLGRSYAHALAAKDFDAVEQLLHPRITFRGLTPGGARYLWESHDPHSVVTEILQQWFEPSDYIEELLATQSDRFSNVNRISYRLAGTSAGRRFVVEQQAYYTVKDGRIDWMSVVCSGFRPRSD